MDGIKEKIYDSAPPLLQSGLVSALRFVQRLGEHDRSFREACRLVTRGERWTTEEREQFQLRALQAVVRHAYDYVPAYRERYSKAGIVPSDIKSLGDLEGLPAISKADIKANPQRFVAANADQFRRVPLHTSGTTGSPFQFFSDWRTESVERALVRRHRSWGGARPDDWVASLGGKRIVPLRQTAPPFWRYNAADRLLWLSAFHMKSANLDSYVEILRRSRVRFLKGYPSNLFVLAHHMRERGLRLSLQKVFTGSEPLFSHVREVIEDRFGCGVLDWYGVSERVASAQQCDERAGYHVNAEGSILELAGSAGEVREIVGTSLSNYAMPLIRYRTGDVSSWISKECRCQRSSRLISGVSTKAEDVLKLPDGRYVSPSTLTHPFKPIRGIRESQIRQLAEDTVRICVVASHEFDGEQEHALVHGLEERLGPDVRIEVTRVSEIGRGPTGKLRWVISEVEHPFRTRPASSH